MVTYQIEPRSFVENSLCCPSHSPILDTSLVGHWGLGKPSEHSSSLHTAPFWAEDRWRDNLDC